MKQPYWPPGPINWAHPLAKYLTAAFTFETGQPVDWVRGTRAATSFGTPLPVVENTPAGPALATTSTEGGWLYDDNDIRFGPPNYTHFFVASCTALGSYGAYFSNSDGASAPGTTNFSQNASGPAMSVWHDFSQFSFGSNTDFLDGEVHAIAISSGPAANSIRVHRDGVVYATGTLKAAGTFNDSSINFGADRFHTSASFTGKHYVHYIFNRQLPDAAVKMLTDDWWSLFRPSAPVIAFVPTATAEITGTASDNITEAEIVAGGETIIITLTGDTWVPAGAGLGQFDSIRQSIINGLDSDGVEAAGWNVEVRDKQGVSGVIRTSDTVVTITLDAQAAYDVTANETITVTVPKAATVTSGTDLIATPTFDALAAVGGLSIPIAAYHHMHNIGSSL